MHVQSTEWLDAVRQARRNTSWYADTRVLFAKLLTPTSASRRGILRWYIAQAAGLSHDRLADRERTARRIKEREFMDHIHVEVWSRDCDCVEGNYLRVIPASVIAFESFCNHEYDNAEGEMSITILSHEEAQRFESYQRDRILEAFEEGETYYV